MSKILLSEQENVNLTETEINQIVNEVELLEKNLKSAQIELEKTKKNYTELKSLLEKKSSLNLLNESDRAFIIKSKFKIQKRLILVVDMISCLIGATGGGLLFLGVEKNNETLIITGASVMAFSLASIGITQSILSIRYKF